MYIPYQPRRTKSRVGYFAGSKKRNCRQECPKARRSIAPRKVSRPFDPSEDWYAPNGKSEFQVISKSPGPGYLHVVTPEQVISRLDRLPEHFLRRLEVVQLSTMTRKKHRFPCYGMQWGCAIYLYPFDEALEENFNEPPPRSLVIESKMFGGRWDQPLPNTWRLRWTESSARDFQLNNVLIHELGHMLDLRNSTFVDQERYAEWFAVEFGPPRTGGRSSRRHKPYVRRRHHGK
jgi:hypothetical protein